MASNPRGKIFFAEAERGYFLKVLFDSLALPFSRVSFLFSKDGITLRENNDAGHILYDVSLPRKGFSFYKCSENIRFSINLKHVQKMVKNIKKKDSVILYIEKKQPDSLKISIKPSGSSSNGYDAKRETVRITIVREKEFYTQNDLPEIYIDQGYEKNTYGYPMIIPASEFQKLKKATSVGKTIKICMQKNNFISFDAGSGSLMGTITEFGEILDNPEKDADADEEEEYTEEDEEEEEEEEEEYSEEEEEDVYSSEEEEEEDVYSSEEKMEDDEEIEGWYEAIFHMSLFNMILKLPGLCQNMQFYAPRCPSYPLKISMQAGGLGEVNVYMKDVVQIDFEAEQKKKRELGTMSSM